MASFWFVSCENLSVAWWVWEHRDQVIVTCFRSADHPLRPVSESDGRESQSSPAAAAIHNMIRAGKQRWFRCWERDWASFSQDVLHCAFIHSEPLPPNARLHPQHCDDSGRRISSPPKSTAARLALTLLLLLLFRLPALRKPSAVTSVPWNRNMYAVSTFGTFFLLPQNLILLWFIPYLTPVPQWYWSGLTRKRVPPSSGASFDELPFRRVRLSAGNSVTFFTNCCETVTERWDKCLPLTLFFSGREKEIREHDVPCCTDLGKSSRLLVADSTSSMTMNWKRFHSLFSTWHPIQWLFMIF